MFELVIETMKIAGNRHRMYEDGEVADNRVAKEFKEAIKLVRRNASTNPMYSSERIMKKIDSTDVRIVATKELSSKWSAHALLVKAKRLVQGGILLTNGQDRVILPGVSLYEVMKVKITASNPLSAVLELNEQIDRYPFNVANYPAIINGNTLEVGINKDGELYLKAGELEKNIPLTTVELKEYELIATIDRINRLVKQVPYLKVKAGLHELALDISSETNVSKLYGMFHAIKDGKIKTEVDKIATFRYVGRPYFKNCYTSTGGTVICKPNERVTKRVKVSYLDISALWREDEVVGVIINSYYRKVVPRNSIKEGVKGWLITEDRVRSFSTLIGADYVKEEPL